MTEDEIVKKSGPSRNGKILWFALAFALAFGAFVWWGGCASTEGLEQGRACPTAREVMQRKGFLVLPGPKGCGTKLYGRGEEPASFCYVKRQPTDALWTPRTVFGNHCGLGN